jgi:hypothetical protein
VCAEAGDDVHSLRGWQVIEKVGRLPDHYATDGSVEDWKRERLTLKGLDDLVHVGREAWAKARLDGLRPVVRVLNFVLRYRADDDPRHSAPSRLEVTPNLAPWTTGFRVTCDVLDSSIEFLTLLLRERKCLHLLAQAIPQLFKELQPLGRWKFESLAVE